MLSIENTYNTAAVFADVIDSGTEGLLRALCGSMISEGSVIRVMPDVHAGKGCAIGTTMTITDKVAPGLVGVDIGCDMSAFQIKAKRVELQKLDKVVHTAVPMGRLARQKPHRFAEQIDLDAVRCARHI